MSEGRVEFSTTAENAGGEIDVEISCEMEVTGRGEDVDFECSDWEFRLTDGTMLDEETALVLLDTDLDSLGVNAWEAFGEALTCPSEFSSREFPYRDAQAGCTVHGYGRIVGQVALGVITSKPDHRAPFSPYKPGNPGGLPKNWLIRDLHSWLHDERERLKADPDDQQAWVCERPESVPGILHPPHPCYGVCLGKLQGRCKPTPEGMAARAQRPEEN